MAEETKTIDKRTKNEKILLKVQGTGRAALPSGAKKALGLTPNTIWELIPTKGKNGSGTLKFKRVAG